MNKKEILKTLDLASIVSIAVATLLVIIFQFTGNSTIVKVALVLYSASFLIATVFFALKTYFVYAKSKCNDEIMFELDKKQKAFLITKLCLSFLVFVFALVVLILY